MTEDRRIARTHRLLQEALISLMGERGYDILTVQDIIDRADVGRSTFYAHFKDKEDLLMASLDLLQQDLTQRQRKAHTSSGPPEQRVLGFSLFMFEHTEENLALFKIFAGPQSGVLIQKHFHLMVATLIRSDIKMLRPRSPDEGTPTEAVVQYLAGAFLALLRWWLEKRPRMTALEADALFRTMAVPTIAGIYVDSSARASRRKG